MSDFAPGVPQQLDVIGVSLTIAVLSLALPLALLQVYDRIIPNQSTSTTALLVLAVVCAVLLEAGLRLARSYMMAVAGARFENEAGHGLYRRLLQGDIGEFESAGPGTHMERFNAIGVLRDHYAGQAAVTLLDLSFAAVYFTLIAYLGGSLVWIPVGVAVVGIVLTGGLTYSLYRSVRSQSESEDRLFNFFINTFTSLPTIRAVGAEDVYTRRGENLQEEKIADAHTVDKLNSSLTTMTSTVTQFATVIMVAFGSARVIEGSLTVGGLAACTLLVGRLSQPLQAAVGFCARLQTLRIARRRVDELCELTVSDAWTEPGHLKENLTVSGTVQLRDVSYRFSESAPLILNSINCRVDAGGIIAITGPNGAGKSALLSLIRGLLSPTSGEVLFDGSPLENFDAATINSQIALVTQHETLFQGSIMDNITGFDSDRIPAAYAAAEKLDLAADINSLPQGFHTEVGEGGEQLPTGTVQRIAIVRALARESKVLLFDDANSAVDAQSDDLIKQSLIELRGTTSVILTTHRPSYMMLADRVHFLHDGVLEETGMVTQELEPERGAA
ncbi:MAG: ATP-binding cassette domain-containing protein [Pseudomonadota bacterium]